ncbi:MAG TPA: hypothetical protein PKC72_03130 [Chitinophagaceae bacterium]|nr:hypothetical protein [Chitinophagaceae bacterium]
MKTQQFSSHPQPVITQTENNTTLWIGHLKSDPTDHFGGQVFTCPSDGLLNNIQVYSSAVNTPGEISMTLHEFDPVNKTWGQTIGSSTLSLEQNDSGRWMRFELEPITLKKEATYGFRMQTVDAMVGFGEAAHAKKPFPFGWAWKANSNDLKGRFYNFFSLAFKVELSA